MPRRTDVRPSYDAQHLQPVPEPHSSCNQYRVSAVPPSSQPRLVSSSVENHRSGWNTIPLVPVPASWPPSSLTSIQEAHRHRRLYSPTPDQSQVDSGHSLDTPIPLPPQIDPSVDVVPYLKPGFGLSINLGLMLHRGHNQWPPIGRNRAELPATHPSIPSMTITHPSLKPPIWITVHHSSQPYVTVWDVLVTLIKQLGLPGQEGNIFDGMRRLDFLPGRNLTGLTKSSDGQDVWIMEVA
ncbi:hypothetical protein K435DRAFT_964387 [Dendrothele bispora CBS 962.96]|uniref:DUF6699 domain-containing protein n=1 Tax=Dendrothele bispora (strain CBS 962.96) TaxID=1314807 RepID=A0A4S8MAZ4_DENBC|nr:hypothetical protein K435DRAFT_964387 [Dendrothele bispora CBS 962.96]